MNLTDKASEIHNNNIGKGFYDNLENVPQDYVVMRQLLLVITEVAEATEELRKNGINHSLQPYMPNMLNLSESISYFEKTFKDKFQDEIGDAMIRLLDLCGYLKIDIDAWINAKLEYNKTRPYKHGKKY